MSDEPRYEIWGINKDNVAAPISLYWGSFATEAEAEIEAEQVANGKKLMCRLPQWVTKIVVMQIVKVRQRIIYTVPEAYGDKCPCCHNHTVYSGRRGGMNCETPGCGYMDCY